METSKVSSRFQVVIPRQIREKLNLKPGQRVAFLPSKNIVQLVVVPQIEASLDRVPNSEDELVTRAQELTGIQTEREVVQEALRMLIRLLERGDIRRLRGKLRWEGDLDDQRESRLPET